MRKITSSMLSRLYVCGMVLCLVVIANFSKAQSWATLGSVGFTVNNAVFTSIALNGSGVPYVAYCDGGVSQKASVMRYTGGSWSTVGSAGFSAGLATYVSMAIDPAGTPYVAYKDVANGNKASVMKFDGTSWVVVGSVGFSAGSVNFTSIAIDGSGTPYVLYQDGASSGKATVMKFNGSSWVAVGSTAFSASTALYCCLAVDGSGTPYVVYRDAGNGTKATVKKFDGTSWVTVGSAGFSAGRANYTYIAVDGGGTPYVTYCDFVNANKASVMKFDGTSWVVVGSVGFSAGLVSETSIAIDPTGKPYVVYVDNANGNKATVMKFDGTSWGVVGSAGISGGVTDFTRIAINSSGIPYIAFNDQSHVSGGATAMTYGTTSSLSPITGTATLCVGATTTLNDATTGGTWSSSATSVATVDSTGLVSGISVGTATISYTAGGSSVTQIVTVNPPPSAGTISGSATLCTGSTTTLTSSASGGVWSSTSSAATVDSFGVVTGVSGGTTDIIYTVSNSCGTAIATVNVVVNALPLAGTLSGITTVCTGSTTTLSSSVAGGIWSSSSLGATVDSLGVITGVSSGTAGITYAVFNSCGVATTSATVTVNSTPSSAGTISGPSSVLVGALITLSDGVAGGTWSSSNPSVGTIGATGIVTGIAAGTTHISYTVSNSCGSQVATRIVTVTAGCSGTPTAGTASASASSGCVGYNTVLTLSGASTGSGIAYQWATSLTGTTWANIAGATSTVCSVAVNSNSYYRVEVTCATSGLSAFSNTLFLTTSAPSVTYASFPFAESFEGTWLNKCATKDAPTANWVNVPSSGNNSWRRSDDNTSGGWTNAVSGVYSPLASLGSNSARFHSYQASSGSAGKLDLYINLSSSVVKTISYSFINTSGTDKLRVQISTDGGANFTSVDSVGVASAWTTRTVNTPVTSATTVIRFMATSDFGFTDIGLDNVTVSTASYCTASFGDPAGSCSSYGIYGRISSLSGSTDFLSDGVACGSTGYLNRTSLSVTMAAGSSYDAYLNTGQVNMSSQIWIDFNDDLTFQSSESVGGNTNYSYSGSPYATISIPACATSGTHRMRLVSNYTGCCGGLTYPSIPACPTSAITYGECRDYTVNITGSSSTISPITGVTTVCIGTPGTLSNSTTGGTWSSSNTAIATIGSTGIVTGLTAGTSNITYTVAGSCGAMTVAATVTVNSTPVTGTISGTTTICVGGTTTLTSSLSGGGWDCSSVGSISGAGVVTGIMAGTGVVSYTVSNSCGFAVTTVNITVTPGASAGTITGASTVLVGSVITLSDTAVGGVWSSSNPSAATVGSTGIVTGVGAGTTTISYTVTGGCGAASATKIVTVNSLGGSAYCGGWATVGGSLATGAASYTDIAIDGSGTPYVIFADNAIGNAASVKKFNGATWVPVGSAGFSGSYIYSSSIAINSSGTPYVTYADGSVVGRISVKRFNGSSWVTVGALGFSAGDVDFVSLAIDPSATPYVAYIDYGNSTRPCVKKFNGTSWVNVGSTAEVATNAAAYTSLAINAAGIPYITYQDGANSNKATTKMFNGSSWVTVGTAGYSASTATYTSMALDNTGKPYVVYMDASTGSKATVKSFSGGSWNTVGTAGFSTGTAMFMDITTNTSGVPYVVYHDGSLGTRATVKSFDGTSWVSVGTPSVSTSIAYNPAIAIDGGGTPYVAYVDGAIANNVSVRKFTSGAFTPIVGTATLCAGSSTTFTNATSGGTWSSTTPSVAAVGSTGIVSAVSGGTATISYTTSGCTATQIVSVNMPPNAGVISGASAVCVGGTLSLTNAVSGGAWSSSNTSVATIGTSGVVTAVASGTANITYAVTSSCGISGTATAMVTVNAVSPITGPSTVAMGGTISLSHITPGGTWMSGTPAVATVSSIGVVSGILGGGTTMVTYTLPTGCLASMVVSVSSGADSLPCGTPIISTVAGAHFPPGYSGDGGPATAAQMVNPTGVKVDAAGNIYTTDRNNLRVRKINTAGVITTIAGDGTDGGGGDGGPATAAQVSFPSDIALDGVGNMYISEGHRIRKVDASGIITTIAGAATTGYVGDGGPATAARFSSPSGLDVDAAGNLYIADRNNHVIRKISTSGTITTVAGTGTAGFSGDGAAATAAQLSSPTYLDVDAAGNIYISDGGNRRIRKVTTSGVISTIAGNGTAGWAGDGGLATAAQMHSPDGVCVDGTGNVFFCVTGGSSVTPNLVRKVNTSGIISTYAGSGTVSGYTGNGGPATAGTLFSPYGITADAAGNIYFGEKNAVVRKVGCASICSVAAIVGSSSMCVGASVSLSDSTAGGVWSSSNGAVANIGSSTGVVSGVAAGTATIIYTVGGCTVSKIVTVNANPATFTLSGGGTYCSGGSVTLTLSGSQISVGYQLFNGFTALGSAVDGTGTPISFAPITASGTYNVYAYSAAGCSAFMGSTVVTINTSPGAITGASTICPGVATTLTDSVTGGVWLSTDSSVATIGFTNGVVIGSAAGTTMITYMLPTGCYTTMLLSVNPSPNAGSISGPASVNVGDSIMLTPSVGSGVWSASNGNATVSSSGVVTGLASGSVVISYSVTNSCGTAVATWTVSVNALAPTVTGSQTTCAGNTTNLTGSPTGGTWTSSNIAIGTVSTSGVVTGVGAGVVNITYNFSGINTVIAVTVNALPSPITGTLVMCANATSTLNSTPAGGTWSSSDPTVATIGPSSNVLSGVSAGTDTVFYTLSTGCSRFVVATINITPSVTGGPSTTCIGSSIPLTNAVAGGVYASSNGAVASVVSNTVTGTGTVTGVALGTSLISYSIGACRVTKVINVIAGPPAISGIAKACPGTTTLLSNTVTGGTWSSANPSVATIDSISGLVTGVTANTAIIVYTAPTGCTRSIIVTINAIPTISGTMAVCQSGTANLTCSPATTSWSSSTPSVATVAGSGLVTASASTPGTTTITATVASTGCSASVVFTVNPPPPAIGGTLSVCTGGGTTSLTNSVGGGTWTSVSTGFATINSSGLVTGVNPGTSTISYSLGGSCVRTTVVTVSPLPTIAGSPVMCVNASVALSSSPAGGTWSSANPAIATVSSGGVVTGVASTTTNIVYTALTGCSRTIVATINTSPGSFSGSTNVCQNATTALTNSVAGGTWSSVTTAVATIGVTSGIVTGAGVGTSTISYRIGTCGAATTVNVMPLPAAITGLAKACPGTSTTLNDVTGGGTWSSSNLAIGSIDAGGVLTGIAQGNTNVTYTAANTCTRSVIATINPNPNPITGTLSMCVGASSSLSSSTPVVLSWTSSDVLKATVNSSGVVTGVAGGTANITYTITTGCFTTAMVAINTAPTPITGATTVCTNATTLLSNATPGGSWTSSNPSIAPIDTNGLVSGIVAGPTVVTYGFGGGCSVTTTLSVITGAPAISGTAAVCVGATLFPYLTTVGAGTWSSSDIAIATVPPTHGAVTGVAAGTALISFTVANGCSSTREVTVSVCPSRGMSSSTTSVGQTNAELNISLYPNPTTGSFVVNTEEAGMLSVYSIEGKEVLKYEIKVGLTELSLPAEITTGVYMCRFNGVQGTVTTVRLIYTTD